MMRPVHDLNEDDPWVKPPTKTPPPAVDPQDDENWVQVRGAPDGVQRNKLTGKFRNCPGSH